MCPPTLFILYSLMSMGKLMRQDCLHWLGYEKLISGDLGFRSLASHRISFDAFMVGGVQLQLV